MKPSDEIKKIAKEIIKEKGGELDLTKATHVLDLRIEAMERYLDKEYYGIITDPGIGRENEKI